MSTPDPSPEPERAGQPLFVLRGVSLERGGRNILRDVNLELPRAAFTSIIGPSGAGKTSLLRLLNRLDEPSAGTIELSGAQLTALSVRALRRRVALVAQAPALFPGSVADNLRTAAEVGPEPNTTGVPDMPAVLEAVGLDAGDAGREALLMSGGEQQRVGIARALMTQPEVLLLDEPTSALDPEAARRLLASIARRSREQRLTVIMVTHRLSEARQYTSHSVMLEAGQVVEACDTGRLFAGSTTARARAYLASGT